VIKNTIVFFFFLHFWFNYQLYIFNHMMITGWTHAVTYHDQLFIPHSCQTLTIWDAEAAASVLSPRTLLLVMLQNIDRLRRMGAKDAKMF
jgi:hypothetical protein